jgi:hypothetical protein
MRRVGRSWHSPSGVALARVSDPMLRTGVGSRTRRVALMIVAVLAGLSPLPASAAGSGMPSGPSGSQAVCVAQWLDSVSPGISMTPSAGTFTSNGQTGTITCVGSVNGHAVTGPGTFGEQGVVNGTCAAGSGSATFSMTIPTDGGLVGLTIPAVFTVAGGVGLRPTGTFPGGFVSVPTRGDCLLTPVTQIAVVLHGTLST